MTGVLIHVDAGKCGQTELQPELLCGSGTGLRGRDECSGPGWAKLGQSRRETGAARGAAAASPVLVLFAATGLLSLQVPQSGQLKHQKAMLHG